MSLIASLGGVAILIGMETIAKRLWNEASTPSPLLGTFPETFKLFKINQANVAGTSFTLSSRHIVSINSEFEKLDPPTKRFLLLRECGHMKQLNLRIANLAIYILAASIFPFLQALEIFLFATCFIKAIAEREADAFALQHATNQELTAGYAYFSARQIEKFNEKEEAKTICAKCKIAWDFFYFHILTGHPLDTTRLSNIQNEREMRELRARAL